MFQEDTKTPTPSQTSQGSRFSGEAGVVLSLILKRESRHAEDCKKNFKSLTFGAGISESKCWASPELHQMSGEENQTNRSNSFGKWWSGFIKTQRTLAKYWPFSLPSCSNIFSKGHTTKPQEMSGNSGRNLPLHLFLKITWDVDRKATNITYRDTQHYTLFLS